MRRSTATRCSCITITIDTRKKGRRRRLIDTKKKRSYYLSITKYWTLSTHTLTRCCHAHMSITLTSERCTCTCFGTNITILVLIHSMLTCTDHALVLEPTFVFTTTMINVCVRRLSASIRRRIRLMYTLLC